MNCCTIYIYAYILICLSYLLSGCVRNGNCLHCTHLKGLHFNLRTNKCVCVWSLSMDVVNMFESWKACRPTEPKLKHSAWFSWHPPPWPASKSLQRPGGITSAQCFEQFIDVYCNNLQHVHHVPTRSAVVYCSLTEKKFLPPQPRSSQARWQRSRKPFTCRFPDTKPLGNMRCGKY